MPSILKADDAFDQARSLRIRSYVNFLQKNPRAGMGNRGLWEIGDAVNYLTIYQPKSLRFRNLLPSSDGLTDCRDG